MLSPHKKFQKKNIEKLQIYRPSKFYQIIHLSHFSKINVIGLQNIGIDPILNIYTGSHIISY